MMIPIEKLETTIKTLVTHKNCPDGMASALLLRDALPHAKIFFLSYGMKEYEDLVPEPGMLFCDLAPHAMHAEAFVKAGAIVLDHHKTARGIVEMFGANGVYADNEGDDPGISGGSLAYQHVWYPIMRWRLALDTPKLMVADANAARFASLAGIRDTWQTDSFHWRKACAQAEALLFYPVDFWMNQMLPPHDADISPYRDSIFSQKALENCLKIGDILLDKLDEEVKQAIKVAYRFSTPKRMRVIVFNSTSLTSDAAEALGKEVDLIVGFSYKIDGDKALLNLSTRSHSGFDCGAFCKTHGGGGHSAAAGCSFKFLPEAGSMTEHGHALHAAMSNPYSFVRYLLEDR